MFLEVMAMNKNKLVSFLTALVIILAINRNVYAEETLIPIDGDVYTWTESVEIEADKQDDGSISISCDAKASDEEYNYAVVSSIFSGAYEKDTVFDDRYAAICIDIESAATEDVSINFILTDKSNNKITFEQNAFYIKETGSEMAVLTAPFSSAVIESGFEGKIILPLSEFIENEDNESTFDYKELTSWSMGILLTGKQSADIYINGLSWLDKSDVEKYADSLDACITGPDSVQIPEHGESIAVFEIDGQDNNTYKFQLDGYPEGVSMDASGKITLDTRVEKQEITIKAVDESGFVIFKNISLTESWRADSDTNHFYGPEELEDVTYAFQNVEKSDIDVVRIVIIAGCAIVFVSYVIFYTKYKIEKKREEEE